MDCHLRSFTAHPTAWLAFIDLDEFFLPEPFLQSGLSDFLARQEVNVGSVCIGRTHVSREADTVPALNGRLASFTHIREPHVLDGEDNGKCLYRTSALELLHVHEPVSFLPGFGYWNKLLKEQSTVRLVHFGHHKPIGPGPFVSFSANNQADVCGSWTKLFEGNTDFTQYVESLAEQVTEIKDEYNAIDRRRRRGVRGERLHNRRREYVLHSG